MIKRATTLVLGAGASAHLRYQTGAQLMESIYSHINPSSIHPDWYHAFEEAGCGISEVAAFSQALRYSGQPSVDAFLEHRTEFISVGKVAITLALSAEEKQDYLFKKPQDNWYFYLFQKMSAPIEEFGENNLSIVTFNYDRSLEHFLHTCITNSYSSLSAGKVTEIMRKIPIIHVHGQIGDLPWQSDQGFEYAAPTNAKEYALRAEKIRVIHEGTEGDPEFQKARNYLNKSKAIYFLGFGYHETNMERLKPPWSDCPYPKGTSRGLTDTEAYAIEGTYDGLKLGRRNWDCLALLRNQASLE